MYLRSPWNQMQLLLNLFLPRWFINRQLKLPQTRRRLRQDPRNQNVPRWFRVIQMELKSKILACQALNIITRALLWSSTSALWLYCSVAAWVGAWLCHCRRLAASNSTLGSTLESSTKAHLSSKKCWNENRSSGSNCHLNYLLKENVYKKWISSSLSSILTAAHSTRPWTFTATMYRTRHQRSARPRCPHSTQTTIDNRKMSTWLANYNKSPKLKAVSSNYHTRESKRISWELNAFSSEVRGMRLPRVQSF